MDELQVQPLKIYIQDIFRAKTTDNKYIYDLFGLKFKNVMINGVVTAIYNTTCTQTNLELSDPTGSVQVYYDTMKNNTKITSDSLNDLLHNFTNASKYGDENINILSKLTEKIKKKREYGFTEGNYVTVVGDIFLDEKNCRMVSAYECTVTSAERDIVWLEELRYMYEKFYLWEKK